MRSTGAAAPPGRCGGIIGHARSAPAADLAAPGRREEQHDYPLGERDYQAVDFAAPYLGAIAELLDEPSS